MYFIGVDDWKYDDWEFTGTDTMYRYFEENPKEALKEGYSLGEEGEVKNLDRLADKYSPIMSLAYPLDCEPDEEKIRKLCQETECTVVKKRDTEEYYLALTGGGMDYSQDVAMGYIIAQGRVPPEMAYNTSPQYGLTQYKDSWRKVAEQCKKELEAAIDRYQRKIQKWEEEIKEIEAGKKEKLKAVMAEESEVLPAK